MFSNEKYNCIEKYTINIVKNITQNSFSMLYLIHRKVQKVPKITTTGEEIKMNTKNINLTYKIMDEMGSFNVIETLVVNEAMTMGDVEGMLKDTHKKEIMLMSYSENFEELN